MKTKIHLLLFAALLSTLLPVRGQIVADGATNTLSNVTNTITGDVIVGTNGSFTLLTLSDNALLTNSATGTIGLNITARSNEVRLVSPTARWQMGGLLFLGSNGSLNRLVVSNGASVRDAFAIIGYLGSASNNQALVTGSGTVWSNAGPLYDGYLSPGNQLVVSNGGFVGNDVQAFIGAGDTSSNNLAVVTGSGSTWASALEFGVGLGGASNQLLVSNGGSVRTGHGYVGVNATASNNLALITGAGSVWSNALDLDIGYFSANNQMIVSNGATVFAAGNGLIGQITNANGNSVTLTDAGSRWWVGSNLYVGSNGVLSRLLVSSGARVEDNQGWVGLNSSSSNGLVMIADPGSAWTNRGELRMGYGGSGNQMIITNSGAVFSANGFIGSDPGANSNTASIFGFGSQWRARDFYVGNNGSFNRLLVDNGGQMANSNGYVGFTGSSNTASVAGMNSLWSNASNLVVGVFGSRNHLLVTNGGTVSAGGNGTIGLNSGAVSNSVLLADAGSTWNGFQDFYLGFSGNGSRLVVSNGATMSVSGDSHIGYNLGSTGNVAVVTGAGSVWSNANSLYVGSGGPANRMVISSGGVARSLFGELGDFTGSDSNVVQVTDIGSVWDSTILYVGNHGRGNRLFITNGGFVSSVLSSIGSQVSANGNEVVVTGAGSVWSNRLVEVGSLGSGNQLTITNGGSVFVVDTNSTSTGVFIGASSIATNSRVTVDGGTLRVIGTNGTGMLDVRHGTNVLNAGLIEADRLLLTNSQGFFEFNGGTLITRGATISNSAVFVVGNSSSASAVWDVRASSNNHFLSVPLTLGKISSFNQLLVTNGAFLTAASGGFIGGNSGANSNLALVAGPGSRWATAFTFEIGSAGSFNSLVVSNGGWVSNNITYLGQGGNSNLALVTGAGSIWTNASELNLGSGSSANQLIVSDGGAVFNNYGYAGRVTTTTNNLALVTGTNAVWTTVNDLFFGHSGPGNRLIVTNGGLVRCTTTQVGLFAGSSNNIVVVTGPGSVLTNVALNVGRSGPGNQLLVNNGGVVKCASTSVGAEPVGSNNLALVTDPGSAIIGDVYVGFFGQRNLMVVSNGATVRCSYGFVGTDISSSNNLALVIGADSVWSNALELTVGSSGRGNQLVLSNGAAVFAGSALYLGANASSTNNRIHVSGASLRVTNSTSDALLEIRRGTNVLDAGLIEADIVRMTNSPRSVLQFNGGTLSARNSKIYTSTIFRIGNGVSPATMLLAGNGLHDWAGNLVVQVTSNAVLTGNGIVVGGIAFQNGSTLLPGTSVGKILFTNSPSLQGTVVMEISKNGTTLTNDQVQGIVGTLNYGGTLTVSNLGPSTLASGDKFRLFNATNYAGSFSSLSLPALDPGLDWTNKLLVDGSIQVVFPPSDRFWTNALGGSYQVAVNWLDQVVPLPPDNAYFTSNSSYAVSWSADALAANAFFNAQSGTVTQSAGAASWTLTNSYILGSDSAATAAVAHVSGGLRVTNSAATARLSVGDAGSGTFNLAGGEVVTDILLVTNGSKSVFNFTSGALRARTTTVNNGSGFVVGTATSPGALELLGGSHSFVNGLTIQPKSLLTGTGSVSANVFLNGSVSPGPAQGGIGRLDFSGGALNFLSSTTNFFDINKATGTNDVIANNNTVALNGTLVVTNLGGVLTNGDRFQLFSSPFFGSVGFNKVILPPLAPGLSWKNKTHVDGSIEVVNTPARDFGEDVSHFQNESGIPQSTWNQMFAEGKRFVFIKATEGLTGPHDPTMSNNVTRALAAGLLAGVYHFAHPENRPTTNGAVLEASNMVVYAGSAIGPGRLRPVLDLERGSGLTTTELTDWVIAFCNEIIAQRGPGAAPIIYTLQSYANDELDSRLADYELWIRTVSGGIDPGTDDPPPQGTYTNALGVFNNWSFWQYSDTGSSGGISPLDLDVCHSEYKTLASFRIPGPPASPIQAMSMGISSNGAFQFTFTNVSGALFTVLATTNLSLPLSNWTEIGFPIETSSGQFQFTDPEATNSPQRFYRVRSP